MEVELNSEGTNNHYRSTYKLSVYSKNPGSAQKRNSVTTCVTLFFRVFGGIKSINFSPLKSFPSNDVSGFPSQACVRRSWLSERLIGCFNSHLLKSSHYLANLSSKIRIFKFHHLFVPTIVKVCLQMGS